MGACERNLMYLFDLAGLEAAGADFEFLHLSVDARAGGVQVRIEPALGRVVRV